MAKATVERLRKENRAEEADAFEQAMEDARLRDVMVKVTWTGDADVDVMVEEPSGTVCSLQNPRTTSGGVLLGDTFAGGSGRKATRRPMCVRKDLPESTGCWCTACGAT